MSKRVKWSLGCAGLVAVAALAVGLWVVAKLRDVPRTWDVRSTAVVAAAPGEVWPLLEAPERWGEWSAWARDVDDGVQRRVDDLGDGRGRRMAFGSPPNVKISLGAPRGATVETEDSGHGRGTVTVRRISDSELAVETVFHGELVLARRDLSPDGRNEVRTKTLKLAAPGHEFALRGVLSVTPEGEGSRVTWAETGDLGAGVSIGMLALAMGELARERHAALLEASLARLQRIFEAPAATGAGK